MALDQNRRAARTIEALLYAGAGPVRRAGPPARPVDLDAVVSEVGAESRTGDLEWHVGLAPATVLGDEHLLERAVTNLVQNAAEHNVAGGRVDVRLTADGETARLVVESSGAPDQPRGGGGAHPAVPARRHGPDLVGPGGGARAVDRPGGSKTNRASTGSATYCYRLDDGQPEPHAAVRRGPVRTPRRNGRVSPAATRG